MTPITRPDAAASHRCQTTITTRDGRTAQCSRRRVLCERFCWQHLPKEQVKEWEAKGWL